MFRKYLDKYKKSPVQVRAAFWFLVCSFLQKGISNLSTPIFTRLMTTDEYGCYDSFNSWLTILTIFISLHLYSGVFTRGLVKFSGDKKVFVSSMQGLSFVLVVIWTIIYLLFHSFWNSLLSLTTVQMLAMLVMIWATSVFSFWAAEQRVEYSYKKLVIVTLIASLAKPIIGVLFVIQATDKVTARILGLALVELVCYSSFFVVHLIRGKKFFSKKYWKHALLFNLPLIPHYLSISVLASSDRIMIKNMSGASEAGIYGLAYSISRIMMLFNNALTSTLTPWIYQKIKSKKTADVSHIAFISLGIIAFLNFCLIVLAPEIVTIFAPKEYLEAIYVIPPVAISTFFAFSYDLFATFEFYYEKNLFIMIASCISAALNLLLNYLLIPIFGYIAAAYTTLICYILYAAAHYYMMNRICNEHKSIVNPFPAKKYALFSIALILSGCLFSVTYKNNYIRYSFVFLIAGLLIVFRRKVMDTIKNIISIKKKKNN